jgi:hypothetical protein
MLEKELISTVETSFEQGFWGEIPARCLYVNTYLSMRCEHAIMQLV